MRGSRFTHVWSMLLAVFVTIAGRSPTAQSASADGDTGSIASTLMMVAAALGVGWLAWVKRLDLPRLLQSALAHVRNLLPPGAPGAARSAGTPTRSRVSRAPDDDDDIATVVVERGSFGSITCVSGRLLGQRWEIPASGLTIGRTPDSDVVVDDTRVSAKHAHLRLKQGQIVVVDDGSTNGVFLNDLQHRVEGEALLQPGDLIMLSAAADGIHFIYRK